MTYTRLEPVAYGYYFSPTPLPYPFSCAVRGLIGRLRTDVVVTLFRGALTTTRKPIRFCFSRMAPPHGKAVLVPPQLNNEGLYSILEANLVKVARSPEEIKELIQAGFEYVTEQDDLRFFRKRKMGSRVCL